MTEKTRAPRNRTVRLEENDAERFGPLILREPLPAGDLSDRIICGDAFRILKKIPEKRFDLLFADPPYNLTKTFGTKTFRRQDEDKYADWLDSWLTLCLPLLRGTASVYICGDWRTGAAIQKIGSRRLQLRNRITWEREKGRGARNNWKNSAEDIWFFTVSDEYTFNLDQVKLRRRVVAPYRDNGKPKDWAETADGNFRDTHPSNIWTDITVPFWSMPENTDHPTQKPEKLIAKIILASTNPGDIVLDPFAGSGTTAVAARKLGRKFTAIESEFDYCLLAAKRLAVAEGDRSIQGFADGVFWERNSQNHRA